MSSSQTHPRRRGIRATSPQMTPLDTSNLLPKAGTFHSPPSTSSDLCDPIADAAFLAKRSETSTENLEDLLAGAGVRRVTTILEQIDRTLSGDSSSSATRKASILADPQIFPVPGFVVARQSIEDEDLMDVDSKESPIDHHHASDSGIGSSVDGSNYDEPYALRSKSRRSMASSIVSGQSAVTRSFSALGSKNQFARSLSRSAIENIQKLIIKPILAEKSLKDFHPLIADVPHRIGNKDISNLRDLEKTLIFLAPIRRYASIMAASRQKQENGEELDEMDYTPGEKITLRGGLSHDGRPVELVREKDGKTIPLASENKVNEDFVDHFNTTKRSLEDDSDMEDDDVRRSMGRRRKSEKPGDVMHPCSACPKEFKRPCDLTKHLKTHSRPFKCPETKCKYHEQGWPTEKERDRHVNDKHSASPPQYKCMYQGCAYVSKRESNCKQHMEKTHGYVYNRSKSNGRTKKASTSNASPNTPLIPSPVSALTTPITPFDQSPALGNNMDFSFTFNSPPLSVHDYNAYRRDSDTTAGTAMTYNSSNFSPLQQPPMNNFENAISPEERMMEDNLLFDNAFSNFAQQPTPAMSTFENFHLNAFNLSQGNVDLNTTVPELSPHAQNLTLYTPENDVLNLDEGFSDGAMNNFALPTGDFQLYDNNATGGGLGMDPNLFDTYDNMGGHFDAFPSDFNFDEALNADKH